MAFADDLIRLGGVGETRIELHDGARQRKRPLYIVRLGDAAGRHPRGRVSGEWARRMLLWR